MAAATGRDLSKKLLKLLLLGNSTVGKTSLMLRFCEQTFSLNFSPTIGVDYKFKTIDVGGRRVKLQIWDTAGQERFKAITQRYYRMAAGILLVYDVTDRASFTNVQAWVESIQNHGEENCQFILVSNKIDCSAERVVSPDEGKALAAEYDCPFFECSARTGDNVEGAFLKLASLAMAEGWGAAVEGDSIVSPTSTTATKKGSCCK